MKSTASIVSNGGWITRDVTGRPRTRFFAGLSAWWTGFSACASLPFWEGWPALMTPLHWTCCFLILPLPFLLLATLALRLTEQTRLFTEQVSNPNVDPHKLY